MLSKMITTWPPSWCWYLGREKGTGWFSYRDKTSLDIFWLRDESLEESDNLSDPTFSPRKLIHADEAEES